MCVFAHVCTYVVGMAELDGAQHLEDVAPAGCAAQPARPLLQLVQHGVVHQLEDEVEAPPSPEHLQQADQVVVSQFLWRPTTK